MNLTYLDYDYYDLRRVRERLHEGEPAFALRASDVTAPQLVRKYGEMLIWLPQEFTSKAILAKGVAAIEFAEKMVRWQQDHPEMVKMPDLPEKL